MATMVPNTSFVGSSGAYYQANHGPLVADDHADVVAAPAYFQEFTGFFTEYPDTTGHADGEVLSLDSETPGWAAPVEFDGGTITTPLTIESDSSNSLKVTGEPGVYVRLEDNDNLPLVEISSDPALDLGAGRIILEGDTGRSKITGGGYYDIVDDDGGNANVSPNYGLSVTPSNASASPITCWDASALVMRVSKAGAVGTQCHAAPTDGAIQTGECFVWFDQTNGAAKLMVKGKTANGTVVTGSVNLT